MSDENTLSENEKFSQSGPGVGVTWPQGSANQNAFSQSRGADVNRILGEN